MYGYYETKTNNKKQTDKHLRNYWKKDIFIMSQLESKPIYPQSKTKDYLSYILKTKELETVGNSLITITNVDCALPTLKI